MGKDLQGKSGGLEGGLNTYSRALVLSVFIREGLGFEFMMVVAGGNVGVVVVADHGLDEAEGAAYHHHHSHHQQHHRHRHHHPLSVPPPHHHHQALQEDDQQQQQQDQSTTTASSTSTTTTKYQRNPADYRQQKMIRDHHQQHGYRCPLCCRTLQDISTMRAHLEHHYPRDSPTCPVASCAKTFSHPNSVRNHMRLKHPVQWDQIKTLRWTYV